MVEGTGGVVRELATGKLVSEGGAWFGYHAASWTESFDMHCSYIVSAVENDLAVASVRLKLGRKESRYVVAR